MSGAFNLFLSRSVPAIPGTPALGGRPSGDGTRLEPRMAQMQRNSCPASSARPEDRLRGEPGTHFPEVCVHRFRAASLRSAPGMTIFVQGAQEAIKARRSVNTVGWRAPVQMARDGV